MIHGAIQWNIIRAWPHHCLDAGQKTVKHGLGVLHLDTCRSEVEIAAGCLDGLSKGVLNVGYQAFLLIFECVHFGLLVDRGFMPHHILSHGKGEAKAFYINLS